MDDRFRWLRHELFPTSEAQARRDLRLCAAMPALHATGGIPWRPSHRFMAAGAAWSGGHRYHAAPSRQHDRRLARRAPVRWLPYPPRFRGQA